WKAWSTLSAQRSRRQAAAPLLESPDDCGQAALLYRTTTSHRPSLPQPSNPGAHRLHRKAKSRTGVTPYGLFGTIAAARSATSVQSANAEIVAGEAGKFQVAACCASAFEGMAMPQCAR